MIESGGGGGRVTHEAFSPAFLGKLGRPFTGSFGSCEGYTGEGKFEKKKWSTWAAHREHLNVRHACIRLVCFGAVLG